jgi:hypothetical protein
MDSGLASSSSSWQCKPNQTKYFFLAQIEALNRLMSSAVASALTEGSEEARQPSFQLPHSFEPETMPELIQVTKDAFGGFSVVGK